ncbi:MAG: DUF4040 domain-containing protein [Cellvibrionaceae bacterium]|nr:DUF4040 domain-containing protein [Cellvibrionaceae bacterium]
MTILFAVFLLSLLVIIAVAIIRAENLFVALMLTTIFSLLMATNFFILDAADVALTEAAIGAGITTVIFLGALALTSEHEKPFVAVPWLALPVVAVTAALLIFASFDNPRLGDPEAPIHQHVVPWYLEQTPKLVDIPNVVTAILGSFRAFDTLGEVFVIFAACIGVLFLLSARKPSETRCTAPASVGLSQHLIPKVAGRFILPFIILFGFYVQFHGDFGPGGGFQAGAIVATGLILFALLEGEERALRAFPRWIMMAMAAGGALLYALVGVAGIAMGGKFLDYSVLSSDPIAGQHLGILLIEAGVGITVCGSLLLIFHAFAARESF